MTALGHMRLLPHGAASSGRGALCGETEVLHPRSNQAIRAGRRHDIFKSP